MSVVLRTAAGGAPVAIVGIGCRFPGGITDAKGYWQSLCDGLDAITEIPPGRMDVGYFFDPRPATPGRIMSRWGGFVEGIEEFDAAFFGISPREAERLDPQQRLLLEIAWEAFEDAGQDVRRLDGSRTGVFVGQWLQDFEGRLFADPELVDFYMTTGSGRYAAAGRLSYLFGLRGPSLSIDSACSSSLAAVHLAVRSIRAGESELALAGGANVILQPHITIAYSQSRMMAPDGRCKFGDASGNGYVRSDGAGLVVLKSLDRARADGDRIYAVIHGSAINNDGRSSGSMGTPSRVGQEELLRAAYRDAGVPPGAVGYVEAHGTGTRAGDPVELGALASVLAEGRDSGHRGFVGSVKTNIGHTEGAAGVAGLIKAALALHHDAIPPSLHFKEPNPSIPWADMPLEVPCALTAWPQWVGPRIAGVSAFGIAGTNAHAVLGEAPARVDNVDAKPVRDLVLLPLSAKSVDALRDLAGRYAELLQSHAAPSLDDVCWSAATRRTPLEQRAVFVADDRVAMAEALRRYAGGEAAACEGVVYSDARPKIAFVCPGQGAQWIGMARRSAEQEPAFQAELARCDEVVRRQAGWSIVEQLEAEPGAANFRLDQIDVIQPVLVAIAIAYAALWRSLGVEPDAVVGHSMGEVAAAHIAGILDLEQAMRIICRRSALMRRKSGMGAMALVDLSMAETRKRLAGREDCIVVAVSNGPRSSVVSGEPDAVAGLLAELERDGVFCRLVKVDVASHSAQMNSIAADLEAELEGMAPGDARISLHSTVMGREAKPAELGAVYWGQNLCRPVLFFDTVTGLVEDGVSTFIELGPHPVLLPSIEQTAQSLNRESRTIACGRRDESDRAVLLAAVGQLWSAGCPIDWRAVSRNGGRSVGLPLYPWQRERHWGHAADNRMGRPAGVKRVEPLQAKEREWLHRLNWISAEESLPKVAPLGVRDTWILLAGRIDLTTGVESALRSLGWRTKSTPPTEAGAAVAEEAARLAGVVMLAPTTDSGDPFSPVGVLQSVHSILYESGGGSAGEGAWNALAPRLWLVTSGAQSVDGHPRAGVDVMQGAMWGACGVIAEEHPEVWGAMIDVDPDMEPDASADYLVRELTGGRSGAQIAFRQERRFELRLQPADPQTGNSTTLPWRADSAYLVTGGLGGVGLNLARSLVDLGVRRLLLMGRSSLPPRIEWAEVDPGSKIGCQIAAIRALESRGVSVHLVQANVADEQELSRALDQYEREGWPKIRGVIHAAGSAENKLAFDMDVGAFERVLAPKLRGAILLDKLLPDLEIFVLVSSIRAFLAVPGVANYAAANAGVDALARDRKSRGKHALSIQWGPWAHTGLHAGEGAEQIAADLARQGVSNVAPDDAIKVFSAVQGTDDPVIAVMLVDFEKMRRAGAGRHLGLFKERFATTSEVQRREGELASLLARAATPTDRRMMLAPQVKEAVASILKLQVSRLDPRRSLGTMGLTSLMAMELRNRLEELVGRPLSATLAWNHPTVDALVGYLAEDRTPVFAEMESAPASIDAPVALPEDISDDDIAALLRAKA